MTPSWLDEIRRIDEERPSFPGEHWLALAGGIALIALALRSRRGGGLTQALAGAGLVWRAASGRDGLVARLRRQTA